MVTSVGKKVNNPVVNIVQYGKSANLSVMVEWRTVSKALEESETILAAILDFCQTGTCTTCSSCENRTCSCKD